MAGRKRVVIVGAGFAGLAAAKSLRAAPVDVFLIDRRNYHLFQPLLYQVATAALSPAQIAQPIRSILRRQKNCTVILGEVISIDAGARIVKGTRGEVPYDYLIIATGAKHAYFGHEDWRGFAPGLKSIEDATAIRQKILSAFEHAENTQDDAERQAFMNFVVVGGGPTGVEMAGAIAELAKQSLRNDFRKIMPDKTRVILAEAGANILNAFPEKLSARARRDLENLGVEVMTNGAVSDCTADSVVIAGQTIAAKTVIWAAGVKASPAGDWLGAEKDRAGRVLVTADLSLAAHPDIFVIGDTAAIKTADGRFVPGLAPAAQQAGKYAATVILHKLEGKPAPAPFAYKNLGTMATIGRNKAIADFGSFTCSGFIAWLLWGCVHLLPLVGFRNRFVVACDWVWAYFTRERGVRLITTNARSEDTDL
ncbi:MAG: NAD(P)/FAD-dependent oxidoreductase [Micavibrio sp.]|nr:NAD(P)/FAD-dependent oxidoreductase [Micavibrio sp.]